MLQNQWNHSLLARCHLRQLATAYIVRARNGTQTDGISAILYLGLHSDVAMGQAHILAERECNSCAQLLRIGVG